MASRAGKARMFPQAGRRAGLFNGRCFLLFAATLAKTNDSTYNFI
jgi:hypothetical protein